MSLLRTHRPAEILLVEDNPADQELTREALIAAKIANNLHIVSDGVEALEFLRKQPPYAGAARPDLILLDLNLPRKDGRQVLAEVKADPSLCVIPIVVFTSSQAEEDILRSYELHANCFIPKPVNIAGLMRIVTAIHSFWFSIVVLPKDE